MIRREIIVAYNLLKFYDPDEVAIEIRFLACNVSKPGMEKAEGQAISIMPDATIVSSGVVHLMELQEPGWSYVRP